MEYKELVKHHTQVIKDQNQNKWEVVETSDLYEICEAYHQDKLKLLGIADVVGRSEQLPCDCGVMLKETTMQVFCPKCYKTWKVK